MNVEYMKMFGAMLLPNIGGFLNGRKVTKENLDSWYKDLKFPPYRPPNWIFGPVWTSLYTSMGYASYLVWRDAGDKSLMPLAAYGTQLALNWAWSPIFFGNHDIKGGLIDIVALTATASTCGILFYRVNKVAGYIFIPYIAWLSFATLLNYSIWKLNPQHEKNKDKASTSKQ